MCGIVAVLSPERPLERAQLGRATAALAHRGPDGSGLAMLHRDRVALGHTRLALVDPLGGAQPIASEDGSVVAVVSGELYDDARLRAELESRGHRFRTRSDSELCVHLYEEHGDELVSRLRGEFAFAIWDERRARLVCGRDRFGVRPLCWARLAGGAVALASEAKALFALGVPARWDASALGFAASAQYTPEDATLFRGVAQVPPGHLLVADAAGVATKRYWDLDFPVEASKREATPEALLAALADSVSVRLRGDAPVACQLSGGLDSSLVAALAARARPADGRALDCFTLSFASCSGGADYDELAIARRTASHIGANLHAVPAGDDALWAALPAAVAAGEGLAVNLHLSAKFLLSRAVRDAGYRVVLTGEGADEVLAGYPHFRRDVLRELGEPDATLAAANGASVGIMMPDGPALPTEAVRAALGFVPSWIEAKAALGLRVTSLMAPELSTATGRDVYREMAASLPVAALRGRARVDQASYGWCKLALANYILRTLGDGMEMAHSVEGRLPFLDHRFFELARSIPTHQKVRRVGQALVEKHVMREAARDLVPEEIVQRRKHPLLAPPLFGNEARGPAQDWLRSADVPAFVDRAALVRTLDQLERLPAGERRAWDPALMTILTATLLHAHYRMELP